MTGRYVTFSCHPITPSACSALQNSVMRWAAHEYSPQEQALLHERKGSQIIGGSETVRDELEALAERTAADELIITTAVHSHTDRVHSCELLAEVVGLRTTPATA